MSLKSLAPVLILGGILAAIVFGAYHTQRWMHRHETEAAARESASPEGDAAAPEASPPPANPNSVPDELVERQRLADLFPETLVNIWGIRYKILEEGEGPKPVAGNRVTVNYVARLLDGTEFDSSRKAGKPYTFRLMSGQVIRGWDESVIDMRKGEKRMIVVPYKYAYGSSGRPPVVPPRAPLLFEIELVDFE